MRFDLLYPQAKPGFRSADGFRRGKRAMRCIICQTPTHWFHEVVCLYFCSPEHYTQYQQEQGSFNPTGRNTASTPPSPPGPGPPPM